MGGGRGEAHQRESGGRRDGLMKLKRLNTSDTEGRCSALTLPCNSFPTGALEEDGGGSAPGTG